MWTFGGQLVGYYQTNDTWGGTDLFTADDVATPLVDEGNVWADVGIQLRANGNLGYGFGLGLELSGLTTLGLENEGYNAMQIGDVSPTSGAITQAYLTYVMDNTTVKVGRQELPKALSPFAFSEGWNVFKNTFDAAVIINSDLPDTTLVGAYVANANNHGSLSTFVDMVAVPGAAIADEAAFMLTAQNKSIDGLTLTLSYYMMPEMIGTDDVSAVWGDANYAMGDYYVAAQGGKIITDTVGVVDTTAFGGKVGGTFGMFGVEVAYSSVDEGTAPIHNVGTQVKTPLYTQMILNQNAIKSDADTIVVRASADTEYGKFGIAYDMTTYNVFTGADNEYTEIDVTYSTKIGKSTEVFAAYVMQTDDGAGVSGLVGGAPNATDDTQSFVRVWARYNF
jgi:hypothetical protein